jgi:hypothetical protein
MFQFVFEPSHVLRALILERGLLPGSSMTVEWKELVEATAGLTCTLLLPEEHTATEKELGPGLPPELYRMTLPDGWFWSSTRTAEGVPELRLIDGGSSPVGSGAHDLAPTAVPDTEAAVPAAAGARDPVATPSNIRFRIEVPEQIRYST